ncbi:MAG: hypothetical protein Q8N89_01260 [Azonexus sp.]|nr:hypothetical protein [Azonexus sp.]
MSPKFPNIGLLPVLAALALPAQAVDLTWSGFGTFGFAVSDQPYNYQRFIDNRGTFKRDTILGGQFDARLSPQWSATIQAKVAPSDHSDSDWQASLAWAFVSWRPSDDWLIRAGKIRLPLMLNTENNDVGATFDFARLPQEVYSISPTTDVLGVSISKTWMLDSYEWILEGYSGQEKTYQRYYVRAVQPDGTGPGPGSLFTPFRMNSSGLVLTVRDIGNTFRIGVHEVVASRIGEQSHADIPFVHQGPYDYYDVRNGRRVGRLFIPVQTFGASISLPADFRMTAEYARVRVNSASEGLSRWGAYLAIDKRIGDWKPYIYFAKMRSTGKALDLYRAIEASSHNPSLPGALRNFQTFNADLVSAYDQWTAALGTSYRLSPLSLLKAEYAHTSTGVVSSFVDAPTGSDSAKRHINVFSLSYNFTF